jgi:hypothetical protein
MISKIIDYVSFIDSIFSNAEYGIKTKKRSTRLLLFSKNEEKPFCKDSSSPYLTKIKTYLTLINCSVLILSEDIRLT